MRRTLLFTIIFFALSFNLIAEETEPTNEELLNKMEEIEAELERVKIESTENNPMQMGETLNWGSGFSYGVRMGVPTSLSLDFMYSFRFASMRANEFNGNLSTIFGFGVQGKLDTYGDMFLDFKGNTDEKAFYSYAIGPKMTLNSRVLVNFISFTSYISPYILFAQKEINGKYSQIDLGLDIGSEVIFWMNESSNMFIGYYMDPSFVNIQGDGIVTNPVDYSISIGFNTFPK